MMLDATVFVLYIATLGSLALFPCNMGTYGLGLPIGITSLLGGAFLAAAYTGIRRS